MKASLYVHVPFCAGSCDYCDFYSVPLGSPALSSRRGGRDGLVGAYIDRLLRDAELLFREHRPSPVPTVYVGGGTPSVLGAGGMGRLLAGLAALLPSVGGDPPEFTVEANPESADRAFLETCRAGGVNRLSLGVQSFHEASRRAVGRAGPARLLPERLALAAELFPGAFSADLLSGLPFQDGAVLREDIERLLSFGPAHVSLYALTVEEGTPLALRQGAGLARGLPLGDEADRLWLLGRDQLVRAGYGWYEVSNFALPGKECRHNGRYWRMENWLALGPAASATLIDDGTGTALRRTAPPDVAAWLDREPGAGPPARTELLDRGTLMKETFLMGLRTRDGLDPDLFRRRFRMDPRDAAPRSFARWRDRGLLREDRPALTGEGLLLLDGFLADVFAELG